MEVETGMACSPHGRYYKSIKHFCRKTWREETNRKT